MDSVPGASPWEGEGPVLVNPSWAESGCGIRPGLALEEVGGGHGGPAEVPTEGDVSPEEKVRGRVPSGSCVCPEPRLWALRCPGARGGAENRVTAGRR